MKQSIVGFGVIFGAWGLGTVASRYAPIPIPASVLGMVILAGALFLGWVRVDWVAAASQTVLRHMVLFFVPAVVGVVAHRDVFAGAFLLIAVSLVGSWFGVIIASAWVAKRLGLAVDNVGVGMDE